MKKISKLVCSMVLTAAVLGGTILSGCAESTNYTEEIKQYQAKLEELEAENQELRAQLGLTETASAEETQNQADTETAATGETAETQQESETETESQPAAETESQTESASEETADDGVTRFLVLGDSIWGNYRDDTGIAARVEYYMEALGHEAKVYNAAIGGTRATLDADDNPYEFGPSSNNDLAKMISILEGGTSVEMLLGTVAYHDMAEVLTMLSDIDVVIIAYGMNDFLCEVPSNDSDHPWQGFGTALVKGVNGVREACPNAEVLLVTPSYASHFPIPVQNYGGSALYNYASLVCDVARGEETLCIDAYNNMGIDAYNADEYLEDGVHLNEKGRDLYARHVVSCLMGGKRGKVSSNSIIDFDNLEE